MVPLECYACSASKMFNSFQKSLIAFKRLCNLANFTSSENQEFTWTVHYGPLLNVQLSKIVQNLSKDSAQCGKLQKSSWTHSYILLKMLCKKIPLVFGCFLGSWLGCGGWWGGSPFRCRVHHASQTFPENIRDCISEKSSCAKMLKVPTFLS